jgi:uncharacterized membrane protein YhhN
MWGSSSSSSSTRFLRCILLLLLLLLRSLSSTTYNCFDVEDLNPRSVGDGFLALHEENHHVFGFWLFQEICFTTVFNVGSRALF